METFPSWMKDDYRKIANKGPLSTLIFGHRFKSDQTLYEYLTEFLLVFVSAKNEDGSEYLFKAGDIIRFSVVKENHYDKLIFSKDVKVLEPVTCVEVPLTMEDTKIGNKIINQPVKYYYEFTLNPDTESQTFIGYDEEGAKEFWLYPEAIEKTIEPEPTPGEDISKFADLTNVNY